jgi:hypothetical protein
MMTDVRGLLVLSVASVAISGLPEMYRVENGW